MENATKRNKSLISALLNECAELIACHAIKNARKAFLMLQRRRKKDVPFSTEYRQRTQADCDKVYIKNLKRFIAACKAPSLEYIQVSVDWKKSRTWGWCPRSYVSTNGGNGEYYASGCGYDKLSASICHALPDAAWLRFCIENWNKIKSCYGFSSSYWLPSFDFAGCGMSTLESMLEAAGWKHYGHSCRTYDRQGSTIAAHYAKH